MDFSYTATQRDLRQDIVTFARAALNDGVVERDRGQVFSRDLWRQCAGKGLAGLPVDASYGGRALDPVSCAVALEALGYGCLDHGLVFGLCAHVVSVVVPIWTFGTPAQKTRYLPGLCDGTLVGAHAMTESASGSDAFGMRTLAERDGDGWRIQGTKSFVTNSTEADVAVVFAITDPNQAPHAGVTAFLVDRTAPGLSVDPSIEKMGLRTVPFGTLRFDAVRVAGDAVLGEVGGGAAVFTHSMDWERSCLFASHVGQIQRLMETAIEFAQTRTSGAKTIGKHQAISHKIADMKIRLEAARLLTYRAASEIGHTRAATLDAAVAKVFVSESLVQTAMDTLQILGAQGYITDGEVERSLRDALASRIYSGTSEVQRNIIAGWLGL